jgi:ABC-type transport system involved in multi-copper enzyme maturation permease subunit
MVTPILFKKEFKQNAVIFIAPYLFLLLIIILNHQNAAWLSTQWAELLTVSLPLAMAGAYGLQAFDLEENGRTKDFLITKPLTLRQIVWAKYASGLLVLLPITVLWIAALLPQSLVAPTLDNVNSFWLTLFLMVIVIWYSASFLSGILIKGPLKLLAGIGIGIIAIGWAGLVWCAALTALFYAQGDRFPRLALTLTYLFSLLVIWLLLKIFVGLTFQILKNTLSFKNNLKPISFTITTLILLPLLLWINNTMNRPAICAFDSLAHSIASAEAWFSGLEGARQPSGKLAALTDARGRLGVAGPYQKPEVVYVSTDFAAKPLQNIAWSPNGRMIAFSDHDQLKLYSLTTKKTTDLGSGAFALWSRDSRQMMIGRVTPDATTSNPMAATSLRRINLSRLNPSTGATSFVGEVRSNELTMAWDSQHNLLFSVNYDGILTILNLTTGKFEQTGLLPAHLQETVFFCKSLVPAPPSQTFAFIVCSFPQSQTGQGKTYTIRWFDLNPQTKKISLAGALKNCAYKDLIGSGPDHSLLVRSFNNGLYRYVKL